MGPFHFGGLLSRIVFGSIPYRSRDFSIHHISRGKPPDIATLSSPFVFFRNVSDAYSSFEPNYFQARIVDNVMRDNRTGEVDASDIRRRSFLDNAARMIVVFRGTATDRNGSVSFLKFSAASGCPAPIQNMTNCNNTHEFPLPVTCFKRRLNQTQQPVFVLMGSRNELNKVVSNITFSLVNRTAFFATAVTVNPTIVVSLKRHSCVPSIDYMMTIVEGVLNRTLFETEASETTVTLEPEVKHEKRSKVVIMAASTTDELAVNVTNTTATPDLLAEEGSINFTVCDSRIALRLQQQLEVLDKIKQHQQKRLESIKTTARESRKAQVREALGVSDLSSVHLFVDNTKELDQHLLFGNISNSVAVQLIVLGVFAVLVFSALIIIERRISTEKKAKKNMKKKKQEIVRIRD